VSRHQAASTRLLEDSRTFLVQQNRRSCSLHAHIRQEVQHISREITLALFSRLCLVDMAVAVVCFFIGVCIGVRSSVFFHF